MISDRKPHFYLFVFFSECGGQFYASTGSIRSPGWPDHYAGEKDCVWIINAPSGQQIELNINIFEMELQRNCRFDHLEIR